MGNITIAEMLQLRELLQMETNAVTVAKGTQALVKDDELLALSKAGIQSSEARIKAIQNFISERDIVSTTEVH